MWNETGINQDHFLLFLLHNAGLYSHSGSLFFMQLKERIFMNKRQYSGIPGKWCKMEEKSKVFGWGEVKTELGWSRVTLPY